MTLLPPNSTQAERAFDSTQQAALEGVPLPLRKIWDPATCPLELLPFLAWGISIDLWESSWSEDRKRAAVASAIIDQRRKGTPASLRTVIDRIDPMIAIAEWFEDRDTMDPHTFRLELPLAAETAVQYDEDLVRRLLRDIGAVKPLRAHMQAVHRLSAQAAGYLAGGARHAGYVRLSERADLDINADPIWANYLQTEEGEPFETPDGELMENA